MNYTERNAATIDRWVDEGWEWGIPISHEQYAAALRGEWSMVLTPTKPVPRDWYPALSGADVLGLASGGGQQMPIFAALGANCTVLDNSPRQIESELMVARREGYEIRAVRGDMTQPLPFADESFDLIFHPVSNCYIEDVMHVWRECHRILRPGGLLMAGLDNGVNFLFDEDESEGEIRYSLPFNPLKDEALMAMLTKNDYGVQFSHTLEEQIRGQIKAGFQLVDLYEDTNGEGFLHEHGVPTFWATLARKKHNMSLREYRSSDCRELADLFYHTVHKVNARDYTKEQLDAWATGQIDLEKWNQSFQEHYSIVALDGGIITGFGDIDSTGYLDRLYVHADYQGKGIASKICDRLEQAVPGDIVTHASITARPFFERRGYKVIKEQQVARQGVCLTNFVMRKER